MKITEVRITEINKDNLKAMANVTFDNCFVVTGLRVMDGKNGLFVSMPSRKGKDKDGGDKYFDTAYPITKEFRQELMDAVLAKMGNQPVQYVDAGDTNDDLLPF